MSCSVIVSIKQLFCTLHVWLLPMNREKRRVSFHQSMMTSGVNRQVYPKDVDAGNDWVKHVKHHIFVVNIWGAMPGTKKMLSSSSIELYFEYLIE